MKSHRHLPLLGLLALLCPPSIAKAEDIPVTGRPVPELRDFDDAVLQVMADNDLKGCTVGVSRGDRVIYQLGFGWRDENATEALPENATMRLASVSRIFVVESIKKLKAEGFDADTPAFDLGQLTPR